MGGVLVKLRHWLHPETLVQRNRRAVGDALQRLRQSRATIDGNIARLRRNLLDFDGRIVEIGLLKRQRKELRNEDRAKLRHALTQRRLGTRRIDRFYTLLNTIDQQIGLLEDSRALEESMAAMQHGAQAQKRSQMSLDFIERVMDEVTEQQEQAADRQQLLADKNETLQLIDGMDDAAIEDELERLMIEEHLSKQFPPKDIYDAQRSIADTLRMPSPPTDPLIAYTEKDIDPFNSKGLRPFDPASADAPLFHETYSMQGA